MDHLNFKRLEAAALRAWKPVQEGFDKLKPKAIEFGKALIELRAACKERGEFMGWLKKHRIDENRAMYCLRLVQGKVKAAAEKRQGRFLEDLLYGEFYRACQAGEIKKAEALAKRLRKQVEKKIEALLEAAREAAIDEKAA